MTLGFAAAPIAVAMANHPQLEKYDLSSLRYVMWAATPIAEDVASRVTERSGIRWLHAYGATEVPGLHCNPVDYPDRWRLDTPGLPVSDLEVRVVDLETHEDVPVGTEGEIIVRGPHMMAGYLPAEADADAFLDGFVRTGDVGWVEPEGWIHITDRAKEMIKVSGFSVAPAEVEATLHGHPAVADCGVYGVSHPSKGEVPKAAVVLTAPDAATADDLQRVRGGEARGLQARGGVRVRGRDPAHDVRQGAAAHTEGARPDAPRVAVSIRAIGTYLPPWGTALARVSGRDEDAVTMAVAAGRAALEDAGARHVVLVTRDLPLLDGGNGAALLAGLGLPSTTTVVEQVGGGPAALDAVLGAAGGTLVIGADTGSTSGSAAVLVGAGDGATVAPVARVQRSLPVRARGGDGVVHHYDDPRLERERGVRAALAESGIAEKAAATVGLPPKDAAALCEGDAPRVLTTGASSPLFALAALVENRARGLVLAFEQATMTAAQFEPGPTPVTARRTRRAGTAAASAHGGARHQGLASCLRARLRVEGPPGSGALPALRHPGPPAPPPVPRLRCGRRRRPGGAAPGGGRLHHHDHPHAGARPGHAVHHRDRRARRHRRPSARPGHRRAPGNVDIGQRGEMVLRRVAERTGIPDYGYAFLPDEAVAP